MRNRLNFGFVLECVSGRQFRPGQPAKNGVAVLTKKSPATSKFSHLLEVFQAYDYKYTCQSVLRIVPCKCSIFQIERLLCVAHFQTKIAQRFCVCVDYCVTMDQFIRHQFILKLES